MEEEGEGITGRTAVQDPWTRITMGGWPEGRGAAAGCRRAKGEEV